MQLSYFFLIFSALAQQDNGELSDEMLRITVSEKVKPVFRRQIPRNRCVHAVKKSVRQKSISDHKQEDSMDTAGRIKEVMADVAGIGRTDYFRCFNKHTIYFRKH